MASVPVDPGRDEARDLARDELSKPSYERDTPLLSRVMRWILNQIDRLLDAATGAFSSRIAISAIVAVVVVLAAVIVLRTGPMARRAARRAGPVLPDRRRTAAEHRAAADAAAARSDWNTAVVERYRAVVTGLEERGVLDDRSGRTADEAAREAGAVLADVAESMRRGAILFDAVRYGGADATAGDDTSLRALDAAVAAARPSNGAPAGPTLAVPL
ncbi:DUF4129 domain-containing protein [Jiangella asiatica]|uniref:DUF4129 domain-containing protein n=1 Tax=Jiangella asiatica TaxID=2530372 RepID=A0A4R5DNP3_9ACTN|nr:DUF4129 domain-containing protein [Jiangella asiatica]TDE15952.1 DUF4129 domain-containing protein [Jiangella asiatica]